MGQLSVSLKFRNSDASLDLNRRLFGVVSKGVYEGDPQIPPPVTPFALRGSVTVTNGGFNVVGLGTDFNLQLVAGDSVTFGTDTTVYQVAVAPAPTSTTFSITLAYLAPTQANVVCYRFFPATVVPPGANIPRVIPGPGPLQVSVIPFVAMGADGMMVTHEGTNTVLTVAPSTVQYVVLRSKYVLGGDPILGLEIMTSAAYAADPDRAQIFLGQPVDYLLVLAKIVSTPGPLTTSHLDFSANHVVNSIGRFFLRGYVPAKINLDTAPLNDPKVVRTGDMYLATLERQFYQWTGAVWQVVGDQIMLATLTQHLAVSAPGMGGFGGRDGSGYPAHPAKALSFNPLASGLAATNTQDALIEIDANVDTVATNLAAHLADAVDAHDASAISFVPTGNITAATTVQAAIAEEITDLASTSVPGASLVGTDAIAAGSLPFDTAVSGSNVDAQLASIHNVGNQAFIKLASQVTPGSNFVGSSGRSAAGYGDAVSSGSLTNVDQTAYTNLGTGLQAAVLGPGIVSGCAVAVSGQNVTIQAGTFTDARGRSRTITLQTIAIPVVNNTKYCVSYNAQSVAFEVLSAFSLDWQRDLPFAIVRTNGSGSPSGGGSLFRDVSKKGAYTDNKHSVTLAPPSHSENFSSMLSAMLHLSLFTIDAPKTLRVMADFLGGDVLTSGEAIDYNSGLFSGGHSRLAGLLIEGNSQDSQPPLIEWNFSGAALFTGYESSVGLNIQNVSFLYSGSYASTASWMKDMWNITLTDVFVQGQGSPGTLASVCRFDLEFFGLNWAMTRCVFSAFRDYAFHLMGTEVGGYLRMDESAVLCGSFAEFCYIVDPGSVINVEVVNSAVAGIYNSLFHHYGAKFDASRKVFRNCVLGGTSYWAVCQSDDADATGRAVDLEQCVFTSTVWLYGARNVVGCSGLSDVQVRGHHRVKMIGCDFSTTASFHGDWETVDDCRLTLTNQSIGGATISNFGGKARVVVAGQRFFQRLRPGDIVDLPAANERIIETVDSDTQFTCTTGPGTLGSGQTFGHIAHLDHRQQADGNNNGTYDNDTAVIANTIVRKNTDRARLVTALEPVRIDNCSFWFSTTSSATSNLEWFHIDSEVVVANSRIGMDINATPDAKSRNGDMFYMSEFDSSRLTLIGCQMGNLADNTSSQNSVVNAIVSGQLHVMGCTTYDIVCSHFTTNTVASMIIVGNTFSAATTEKFMDDDDSNGGSNLIFLGNSFADQQGSSTDGTADNNRGLNTRAERAVIVGNIFRNTQLSGTVRVWCGVAYRRTGGSCVMLGNYVCNNTSGANQIFTPALNKATNAVGGVAKAGTQGFFIDEADYGTAAPNKFQTWLNGGGVFNQTAGSPFTAEDKDKYLLIYDIPSGSGNTFPQNWGLMRILRFVNSTQIIVDRVFFTTGATQSAVVKWKIIGMDHNEGFNIVNNALN